ncbi:hypothetical protein [Alteromonas flava]|uniref:hypothetical protein n=1 Tax=Alteromonas flava TaxID=2048003 RepID=UPI000C291BB0|nr:hypothetical protein [Alteromonas flava]
MKPAIEDDYLTQVQALVDEIAHATDDSSSIMGDVSQYFINAARRAKQQLELKVKIAELQDTTSLAEFQQQELDGLIAQLDELQGQADKGRQQRLQRIRKVCQTLNDLCEGKNKQQSQHKTAKFLASLWLLSEQHEGHQQNYHQRLKIPYKMALTLRLVDEVIEHQLLRVPNWLTFSDPEIRFHGTEAERQKWFALVAIPALTSALFQDAGLFHPLAIKLLRGNDKSKDPFRVLDNEERTSLLKMNYRFSIDYVTSGLGVDYGTAYATPETQVLAHATLLELVKDAYKPATGIGELLKIPQIYASVVFSTKQDFQRSEVPKGCMLIDQLAKKGVVSEHLAQAFNRIVGAFPQGYGLFTADAKNLVFGLYPTQMHEPTVIPLLSIEDTLLEQEPRTLTMQQNYYFTSTREAEGHNEQSKQDRIWDASRDLASWSTRWEKL